MVKAVAVYRGQLHCEVVHEPSDSKIATDAPKDNNGKGESFSPTDLVAAALASCALTTVALVAERSHISLQGARCEVAKDMHPNPRRIAQLLMKFTFPPGIPQQHRKKLEHAVAACPVHKSLHPDINAPIEFIYQD